MAAVQMGETRGFNERDYIGTSAERDALVATDLGCGSTFYVIDGSNEVVEIDIWNKAHWCKTWAKAT